MNICSHLYTGLPDLAAVSPEGRGADEWAIFKQVARGKMTTDDRFSGIFRENNLPGC